MRSDGLTVRTSGESIGERGAGLVLTNKRKTIKEHDGPALERIQSGVRAIVDSQSSERGLPSELSSGLSVLVIDDEPGVSKLIGLSLGKHGFHVRGFTTAAEALRPGAVDAYDVLLLDINLGAESGLDVCRQLRAEGYDAGIVMLTGFEHVDTKVKCLDAGADDYLVKPADGRELRARLDAVARRYRRPAAPLLEIRGRAVRVRGVPIALTRTELSILRRLDEARPNGVSREVLLGLFETATTADNALNVHISRLRKKLAGAGHCLKLTDQVYWLDI